MPQPTDFYDLAIVGGGINGAGIARDGAGRGLKVALFEQGDLGGATSSASSKLIHGGLRYLEHYEFRLVGEALAERETLLAIAPHIVAPLTFVLPRVDGMRPRWMLRAGLWLYDRLARRSTLPGARSVRFATSKLGTGLKHELQEGFAYSDCWVDDARLVILNCLSAEQEGAAIQTRSRVLSANLQNGEWRLQVQDAGGSQNEWRARALVNAAGPWVHDVLADGLGRSSAHRVRLVKGSHIVTSPLYEGDHAFILQNDDGRVVLVIPFRGRYSLIGTTDIPHDGTPDSASISVAETEYLCRAVNRYFTRQIGSSDVLWSFSGVRPLYDDGATNPSKVTRDYKLLFEMDAGAPLLSIYGGKITTYRRLAEHALEKFRVAFPHMGRPWTAEAPLPGGDMPSGPIAYAKDLSTRYPDLRQDLLEALVTRHGTLTETLLGARRTTAELGHYFGNDLYGVEVDYFIDREWARTADDVLWRRTKAGLGMDDNAQADLARYMAARVGCSVSA